MNTKRSAILLIILTAAVFQAGAEEPERLDFNVDFAALGGFGYHVSYEAVWSAGVGAEFLWDIPWNLGIPWSMGFNIDAVYQASFTYSLSESGTLLIPFHYRTYLRLGRNAFVAGFGPEIAIIDGFSDVDFLISVTAGLSIPVGDEGKLNFELRSALDANPVPEHDYLMLQVRYGF